MLFKQNRPYYSYLTILKQSEALKDGCNYCLPRKAFIKVEEWTLMHHIKVSGQPSHLLKPHFFSLKVDMPILTCIFFTFNWLTLTSEMHFVKFHPVVASCLLSRGKRKYAPLGMRLLWKYIRNYFLVYQLISPFLVYLQNYKEFEAEILDLQSEKYGLSFDIKKYTTSGWALGDENVIGIRAFKIAMVRKPAYEVQILASISVLPSYSLIAFDERVTFWASTRPVTALCVCVCCIICA